MTSLEIQPTLDAFREVVQKCSEQERQFFLGKVNEFTKSIEKQKTQSPPRTPLMTAEEYFMQGYAEVLRTPHSKTRRPSPPGTPPMSAKDYQLRYDEVVRTPKPRRGTFRRTHERYWSPY